MKQEILFIIKKYLKIYKRERERCISKKLKIGIKENIKFEIILMLTIHYKIASKVCFKNSLNILLK